MRTICWMLLLLPLATKAQVKIHSHNDYAQQHPLFTALEAGAFSIEADVFYRDGLFYVAHAENEIDTAKTLQKLYLQPLISRSLVTKTGLPAVLLIDLKEKDSLTLQKLHGSIQLFLLRYRSSLQIIISGERGSPDNWELYPAFYFDGRPTETYSATATKKLGMISQSYQKYVSGIQVDSLRLREDVQKAHREGKLFRLWANPDDQAGWIQLQQWGIDLINTDHPLQCRAFFGY